MLGFQGYDFFILNNQQDDKGFKTDPATGGRVTGPATLVERPPWASGGRPTALGARLGVFSPSRQRA